jgi:hypothetical protein
VFDVRVPTTQFLAQNYRPAGGAALDQVAIATGIALVLAAIVFGLGYGHRTGKFPVLGRLAAIAERSPVTRGLPAWVALPLALALVSLMTALLGMYWDISLHITRGRDEGPLANIAHYPILFGLFGIFSAGVLAIMLPRDERPGPAAIRISGDWHAPVGGVLLAGAGFYALLGFPLDDVWHRIFGQDVTLWGPTHLMLLGGAGLSLVAMAVLEREGQLAGGGEVSEIGRYIRRGMAMGGLLIGLSVFQAEFDFGVPQFRMVNQPLLIAMAAACALVAARMWVGRGAALFAVGFYYVVRGGVSVIVGGLIGQLWAAVPLYLGEALLVELLAVYLVKRPLRFGLLSGLAIGTLGFASEYLWTGLVMPHPWNGDMVVEGLLMAIIGGVAGGTAGALLGSGLTGALPKRSRALFIGSLVLLAAGLVNTVSATVPQGVTATITMGGIAPDSADSLNVQFNPPGAVDRPTWLELTGWQGGGLHIDHLVRGPEGSWQTTRELPLGGDWKLLVRLHDGRNMAAVPIFLPADPALGATEVPAMHDVTRDAVREQLILQRELKQGVPTWIWSVASVFVLLCTLTLLGALAWGVARVSRSDSSSAVTATDPVTEPVPSA